MAHIATIKSVKNDVGPGVKSNAGAGVKQRILKSVDQLDLLFA